MFFKIGVHKNSARSTKKTPVLESLDGCNFTKKRLQHSCFPVSIAKSLITAFLWNDSGGCDYNFYRVRTKLHSN